MMLRTLFVSSLLCLILLSSAAYAFQGYKQYKFGLTEKELQARYPDAKKEECVLRLDHGSMCYILENQKFLGYEAKVSFYFHEDSAKVNLITFGAKVRGNQACDNVERKHPEMVKKAFPEFTKDIVISDIPGAAMVLENQNGDRVVYGDMQMGSMCTLVVTIIGKR